MSERICKRCLMWENMPDKMLDYLETYIGQIPDDDKVDNAVLEERLAICNDCKYFQEGLCKACGCYVSLRAAVKKQRCPYRKW